jgi:hypothetical protein
MTIMMVLRDVDDHADTAEMTVNTLPYSSYSYLLLLF